MAAIENFILRFKVEGSQQVRQVSGAIQNLSNDLAAFGAQGGVMGNTIGSIISRLGPLGAAAGASGAAFAAFGLKAVQISAQLSDLAGATGIAESSLLAFKFSVIEAGGGVDDFVTIASKFNQSVQEAAAGNEKFIKAFNDMGVYILDAGGKLRSTESILADVLAKFNDGEITSKEFAAAVDLLGKNINKLELEKLAFKRDPEVQAQIEALDRMSERYDRLIAQIEKDMVKAFGNLALAIEGGFVSSINYAISRVNELIATILNLPTDAIAGVMNMLPGVNIKNPVGLGTAYSALTGPGYTPTAPEGAGGKQLPGSTGGGTSNPISDTQKRLAGELKILENMSVEYEKGLANENLRYELATKSLMQSKENADKMNQLNQMDLQYRQEVQRLDKQIFDLEAQGWVEGNRAKIAALKKEKDQYEEVYDTARAKMIENIDLRNQEMMSFEAGWSKAFRSYMDNATKASVQAEQMFNAVTSNMNAALDNFVETGKMNFSDLATSIIKDIVKIQLRAAAANLLSSVGFGSIFGLEGRAIGGPVAANTPYIVGEKGPELFMPNGSGTIIPNNKLSSGSGMGGNTYITNNISAIDSKSVAQMFAENRQTLFGNVELARRELPMRTR